LYLRDLLLSTTAINPTARFNGYLQDLSFLNDVVIDRSFFTGLFFEPYAITEGLAHAALIESSYQSFALTVDQHSTIVDALRQVSPAAADEFTAQFQAIVDDHDDAANGNNFGSGWVYASVGEGIVGLTEAFFGNILDVGLAIFETFQTAYNIAKATVVLGPKVALFDWNTAIDTVRALDDFLWDMSEIVIDSFQNPSDAGGVIGALFDGLRGFFFDLDEARRASIPEDVLLFIQTIENAQGVPTLDFIKHVRDLFTGLLDGYTHGQILNHVFNIENDFWAGADGFEYSASNIFGIFVKLLEVAEAAHQFGLVEAYRDGDWAGQNFGGSAIADPAYVIKLNELAGASKSVFDDFIPAGGVFGLKAQAISNAIDTFLEAQRATNKSDMAAAIGEIKEDSEAWIDALEQYKTLLDDALQTLGPDWGKDVRLQLSLLPEEGDFFGTENAEEIQGSPLADNVFAGAGNDFVRGHGAGDDLRGEEGDDELWGDAGADFLFGGIGDDTLRGGLDDDELKGEDDNDTLFGEQGNDRLFGDGGDDELRGGADNDTLFGGEGSDLLFGGPGSDTFVIESLTTPDQIDVIGDFNTGDLGVHSGAEGDVVDVSALTHTAFNAGTPMDELARVTRDATSGLVLLEVDPDGAGGIYGWNPALLLNSMPDDATVDVILGVGQMTPNVGVAPDGSHVEYYEAGGGLTGVVYSQNFSSNPNWTTDLPQSFGWDSVGETYVARTENFQPSYAPNRFGIKEIELDVSESFSISWDQRIVERQGSATTHFGLYSGDLVFAGVTNNSVPRITPESTLNVGSAKLSNGEYLDINIYTGGIHGDGQSSGGTSPNGAQVGIWFNYSISYDALASEVEVSIAPKDGEVGAVPLPFSSITRDVNGTFSANMTQLGISHHPTGHDPNTPQTGYQIVEYDNIEVIGVKESQIGVSDLDFRLPFYGSPGSAQGWGERNDDIFTGAHHLGHDYSIARFNPTIAVADGTVVSSFGDDSSEDPNTHAYGNHVIISHDLGNGETIYSLYAHLEKVEASEGPVSQGAIVGAVGSSGRGNGAQHLHFELSKVIPTDSGPNGGGYDGVFDVNGGFVVEDGAFVLDSEGFLTGNNSINPEPFIYSNFDTLAPKIAPDDFPELTDLVQWLGNPTDYTELDVEGTIEVYRDIDKFLVPFESGKAYDIALYGSDLGIGFRELDNPYFTVRDSAGNLVAEPEGGDTFGPSELGTFVPKQDGQYIVSVSAGDDLLEPWSLKFGGYFLSILERDPANPSTNQPSAGDDVIIGGDGNDVLSGGPGSDTLLGGGGADTFKVRPGDERIRIADFEIGTDILDLTAFSRAEALQAFLNAQIGSAILTFEDGTVISVEGDGVSPTTLTADNVLFAPNLAPSVSIGNPRDVLEVKDLGVPAFLSDPLHVADIAVSDDGFGENFLSLSGRDAGSFFIRGSELYLAAGSVLHEPSKPSFEVIIEVDDPDVGITPDDTAFYKLLITTGEEGNSSGEPSVSGQSIVGTDGPDVLLGGYGDDTITAQDGDDMISGRKGNDGIDGGEGVDVSEYSGNSFSYMVSIGEEYTTVADRRPDGDGVDMLMNVERLSFLDQDIDLSLISGATGVDADDLCQLVEYYIAFFDRAPDAFGLYFWASAISDGMSQHEVVEHFFNQDEVRDLYGDLSDLGNFVTTSYQNVLGREADNTGYDFWTEVLETGKVQLSHFIMELIEGVKAVVPEGVSQEFADQKAVDASYLAGKKDLGVYFSAIRGMSDVENASTVIDAFDGSALSLLAARNLADQFFNDALGTEGGLLIDLVGVIDDPFGV
jgi:Ca2+-binding RTX toxin-like protein